MKPIHANSPAKQNVNKNINDELENLKRRIDAMGNEIMVLKSKQAISERITDRLRNELDKANQYTRRNCVILSDVPVKRNEKPQELEEKVKTIMGEAGINNDIINDIDKLHPVGKTRQNKQKIIIRFRSHSKRYAFFAKRKSLQNNRVTPALTRSRNKLLSMAKQLVKGIHVVNFVYADINGDIKVRFKEADKQGRFVFGFSSFDDLACLICGLDYDCYSSDGSDCFVTETEGNPPHCSDDEF